MARSTSSMASYYALLLSAAGLASSAALASTALSCPASNGTTVSNSTAGTTYTIECGIDRYDNDLGLVYKPTLETCIDACNDHPKCVDVSWIPGNPGPCYLKQGVGAVEYKSEIWGARMTQTTRVEEINWPASNGTQYKDPNVSGRVYEIECDTDHFDTDYSTNPIYVAHLEECIAACDKTTGCQVGVLYGAACYLKHGVNPAIHMPGALGARCISGCQAVLSSSSTGAASTTTTAAASTSKTSAATTTSTTMPLSTTTKTIIVVPTSTSTSAKASSAASTTSTSVKASSTASTTSTSVKLSTSVTTLTTVTTSTTVVTPSASKPTSTASK
ncbi:hypothetical protein LTR91_012171 [Friedmanniomyces endolithicus]|uniref:Apple domain-containing protein n=1 Tax=Friedmanniomyces endolithicus TaxID=329885 RepID=A0AAN6G0U5_9PEZI|nr:hypothetical protein LTS09_005141 [Friedmanniomyces endolithicus]KAK0290490.1 hypothetical protein LTR35_002434 [Friedmanniomyces endolithicus]KAK0295805.1 hypothetical protein LTS00_005545 [Friedmanniomyces endolithicus]KAK0325776.1 hypothetical protein LTR82_003313 [Friedmanniomyces endolithicus]KAK0916151.1 hypothetical protein LTR57_013042 [Friedmanniomyces endolithicus]